MDQVDQQLMKDFIKKALFEDIQDGDHTSLACVPASNRGRSRLLVKDEGVLAGVELAKEIFKWVDPAAEIEVLIEDGHPIKYGDEAFFVNAGSQNLLKAERLVLNSMQRMSGIATHTRQFVDLVSDLPVTLLDTRKTTPLLRFLEKWAVRIGGATNYRDGLYDRIMIKDNHVDFCGTVSQAILQVNDYLKNNSLNLEITVEVRNNKELEEVLAIGQVNRIMLDNYSPEALSKALAIVDGRFETEASGGINLKTVRAYAETGVDFISVGAFTHSYNSLDLSLKSVK